MSTKLWVAILTIFIVTGCAYLDAPFQPPIGMLYTNIKAPLKTNINQTPFNINKGEARTLTFQYGIWSFSAGDSSARSAMVNAFVNQADYADYSYVNILLGLYESVTVIAYGENISDDKLISIKNHGD